MSAEQIKKLRELLATGPHKAIEVHSVDVPHPTMPLTYRATHEEICETPGATAFIQAMHELLPGILDEIERAQGQEKQTATALDGFLGDLERAHNAQVPTEIRCPKCDKLHVDQDEWATTRLHRKHLCHDCGNIWAPYSVTTVGVDFHVGCRETLTKVLKSFEAVAEIAKRSDDITKRRDELLKQAAALSEEHDRSMTKAEDLLDRSGVIVTQLAEENKQLHADVNWLRSSWETEIEENKKLTARRDELLAMVAKLSQAVPLESEVAEALNQRGALLAEVGTLRARVAELEKQAKGDHVDMRTEYDGTDYG